MIPSQSAIRRLIFGAYVSFVSMVLLCSILYPAVFTRYEYGISTFGSVWPTLPFYYVGFAITIACLIGVAGQLHRHTHKTNFLQLVLAISAICMIGIAATSYSQRHSVYVAHVAIASLLAVVQLITAIWLITRKEAAAIDYLLAVGVVSIVIISILPNVGSIPVLRSYPLRETLAFICALGLLGRAALNATTSKQ